MHVFHRPSARCSPVRLAGLILVCQFGLVFLGAPLARAQDSRPNALPEPAQVVTTEQAQAALTAVRAAREASERERRAARFDCASRLLTNRCNEQADRLYRLAGERERALERHAQLVIREAANLQANEQLALRERETALRIEESVLRATSAAEQSRARQADRDERARAQPAREQQERENAARSAAQFAARQKAREERAASQAAGSPAVRSAAPALQLEVVPRAGASEARETPLRAPKN